MAVAGPMQIAPGTELGLQAALQGTTCRAAHASLAGFATACGGGAARRPRPHRTCGSTSCRGLVFVRSPDRGGRAGVADGACLVHRPERERVFGSSQQAVDLDAGAIGAGQERDMPHATPPDSAAARSWRTCLCLDDRHGNCLPSDRSREVKPKGAYVRSIGTSMTHWYRSRMRTLAVAGLSGLTLDSAVAFRRSAGAS